MTNLKEGFMYTKSLHLLGLIAFAAATLHGQPTNGPVYWSTTMPDCSSLSETAVAVTNSSGGVVGYSCYVSGTFVWLAAGGGWTSAIRVGAPATAPIGVDYTFYDNNGNNLTLDTKSGASSSLISSNVVSFALSANQPSEVDLLGATSNAPTYAPTTTGTAYAVFYCPDATTCNNVLPQLIYLQQPTHPWLATVPIVWDNAIRTHWSAEGVDDGATNVVSFVVYNESTIAATFTVDIYDSAGTLFATGTTPSIPPLQSLGGGSYGEGGIYGADLRTVITGGLPSGTFKILIDGGTIASGVQMFQITGPAITSMQIANDSAPNSSAAVAATTRRAQARTARAVPAEKRMFAALQQ
jgi:hypothetical protein